VALDSGADTAVVGQWITAIQARNLAADARLRAATGARPGRNAHRAPGPGTRHRTLVITRKGGKVITIPPASRTASAIDLTIGERTDGPLFLNGDGRRLDRHGATRIVHRVTRRAGIAKQVGPHTLRHAFISAALDPGVPLRDAQEAASHADPSTTMRSDRAYQPRPARHLHRRHLHCRGSDVTPQPRSRKSTWPPTTARPTTPATFR
jgi:integrase